MAGATAVHLMVWPAGLGRSTVLVWEGSAESVPAVCGGGALALLPQLARLPPARPNRRARRSGFVFMVGPFPEGL